MRVLKIKNKKLSKTELEDIVRVLKNGGVITYPTETSYGFGADFENEEALRRIFQIKERNFNKQMLLVAGSLAQVKKIAWLLGKNLELANKYWPGPLSLILKWKGGRSGDVGIRVSGLELVRQITLEFGKPIISTSANIHGQPNPYTATDILATFAHKKFKPDIIIDGGKISRKPASTIVQVKNGKIKVLRQGEIVI